MGCTVSISTFLRLFLLFFHSFCLLSSDDSQVFLPLFCAHPIAVVRLTMTRWMMTERSKFDSNRTKEKPFFITFCSTKSGNWIEFTWNRFFCKWIWTIRNSLCCRSKQPLDGYSVNYVQIFIGFQFHFKTIDERNKIEMTRRKQNIFYAIVEWSLNSRNAASICLFFRFDLFVFGCSILSCGQNVRSQSNELRDIRKSTRFHAINQMAFYVTFSVDWMGFLCVTFGMFCRASRTWYLKFLPHFRNFVIIFISISIWILSQFIIRSFHSGCFSA